MNVRFGRILALGVLIGATVPAVAGAAGSGGPILGVPSATDSSGASTPKQVHVVTQTPSDQNWSTRGAAEVLISDTEPQPIASAAAGAIETPVPSAVPSIGWRSPRQATSENKIRFTDASAPSPSPAPIVTPTAIATRPASAAAANFAVVGNAAEFELQLRAAALAAKIYAEDKAAEAANAAATQRPDATVAQPPANTVAVNETAQKPAANIAEPQALQDGNIQLAITKFEDAKVKAADSEEPMPAPEAPYAGDKPLSNGVNEPCECIDGACCPPPRPLFWTSGIEATFLRPDLNNGFATFSAAEFSSNRFDEFSTSTDDVDDFYMSPRIWFGVQGCLWGANLRYWHLRANEGSFDPTLGSDGEWDGPNCGVPDFGYTSCNDLEAYTVDLEVTRRVCMHDCWMQFSGGVRHAEIEQDASVFGTALADDSVLFGFAAAHRQTRGTGIVLGWYGRKPIFPCSCVHWFYNFHWSAVWGPTQTAAETGVLVSLTSTDPDAVAAAGSVNGASTTVDDNMFIGEIQLGLEWDYALQCLPANAFCRVALEYQRWTGGQGFSAANSFAGIEIDDEPTTLGDAFALADSPELDLVGLAISTGLTW